MMMSTQQWEDTIEAAYLTFEAAIEGGADRRDAFYVQVKALLLMQLAGEQVQEVIEALQQAQALMRKVS